MLSLSNKLNKISSIKYSSVNPNDVDLGLGKKRKTNKNVKRIKKLA